MHNNLIKSIESVIRLEKEEKEFVQEVFKQRTYDKGDYFLREGQVCKEIGFIEKGLLKYFENDEGKELIYDFGKEGDYVCNYESFLDHSVSAKNIQFIEDSSLLIISFANLQLFYDKVREGQKFGRIVCEQLFVQAIKKITSLYKDQPVQRYECFMESYPDLQQRIPQYSISSFVGVKPQSLSRIRKRLSSH